MPCSNFPSMIVSIAYPYLFVFVTLATNAIFPAAFRSGTLMPAYQKIEGNDY